VDHTLRLIQHNWVVLAYNFNIVIWVLIIGEVRYMCISAYPFIIVLSRLSFVWCYGVFRYSVPLRVVIVFRDTIYIIIIILYL
jgi:hypothetical protein